VASRGAILAAFRRNALPVAGGARYHRAMHSIVIGFGFGFVVALQLGPMSLYLVRSTLRGGWAVGFAIAAAIALVDAAYAAAGAAGAAPLLAIGPLRTALSVLGAAVLVWLGVRTLRRAKGESDDRSAATTPTKAFATAIAGTAANPATIASWAAVFAAAGATGATDTAAGTALLVAGVGFGSLAWMSLLTTGTATARRAVGPRAVRVADVVAGSGLLLFGSVLALSAG
jgi:putative LysE/RhtB family amino acid efflux pump